ncbi:MAG: MFS transporter [Planctomycetota bacterium]
MPLPPDGDPYARSAAWRWVALAAALLAWTFDGVEQGVYTVVTRPALKDMVPGVREQAEELARVQEALGRGGESAGPAGPLRARERELRAAIDGPVSFYFGITFAMWLWGAALGGIVFGRLGDRHGRVKPLALAVVTYSVFTGLSALSGHWSQLAACRFLGALGLGGAWPLSVAIIVETWPESRRSVLAGLMGAGANVGYLIAGTYSRAMTACGFDWRWVLGAGAIIGLLSLPVIACLPETPRWRESMNAARRSSLRDLFRPAYRRSTIAGSLLSTVALLGTWGSFLWFPAYVDQISEGTPSAGNARSIVLQWQSLGQIAGGFLGGLIAKWFGNKPSWRLISLGAWISVVALFALNREFTGRTIAMAILAGVFVTSFFGWLPKFLPELYPTSIRATGQGFAYNIGRVLTGIGVLGGGALVSVFHGDYRLGMIAMASVYLLGIPAIALAPETGGRLPEERPER